MKYFNKKERDEFFGVVTDPLVSGAFELLTQAGMFDQVFIPRRLDQGGFVGSRSVDRAFEFYRQPDTGHMILWDCFRGDLVRSPRADLYFNQSGTQHIGRITLHDPVGNPMLYGFEVKSHYDTPQAPEHLELVGALQMLAGELSMFERVGVHSRNLSDGVIAELTNSRIDGDLFVSNQPDNMYILRRPNVTNNFFRRLALDNSGKSQSEALNKLQVILNRESNLE